MFICRTKSERRLQNENLKICEEIKGALQDEYSTEVYCASSIEEAIEVFVKHRFCLVILDVHLAGSDALKLLGIMRQVKPIPILVLSGKDKPIRRSDVLRAGASAYMEEPFELEKIMAQAHPLWNDTLTQTYPKADATHWHLASILL